MNKLVLFLFMLFCITNKANAQDIILVHHKPDSLKFIQKVEAGFIFGSFGVFSFEKMANEKPFKLGYAMLSNVAVITPVSYHELIYDYGANGFGVINGWFFGQWWDTYVVYTKEFDSHYKHVSWGVERKIPMGEANAFPFLEIGTDFEGHRSALIGVLVSYQFDLYQRDH